MIYDNPEIADDINVSRQHPLAELAWLLAGTIGLIALIVVVLGASAQWLAGRLPFAYEQQLAANLTVPGFQPPPDSAATTARLQTLANQLSQRMQLPAEMRITVHLVENDDVNAFATLGGHVFVFSGLLDNMPDENTLAMVLAHEIAHIKHRDPVRALGRGAVVMLSLSALLGNVDRSVANSATQSAALGLLHYSREQELAADQAALAALQAQYGHIYGADKLFTIFAALPQTASQPTAELTASHPSLPHRRQQIAQLAQQKGYVRDGKPVPGFWQNSPAVNPR